jgi:hypothetical protein
MTVTFIYLAFFMRPSLPLTGVPAGSFQAIPQRACDIAMTFGYRFRRRDDR